MAHLKRAGILAVVLLAAVFIIPRVIPIPESLFSFGFHRSDVRANEELWASLPMQYAHPSTCTNCHQKQYNAWQQAKHSTVSCENCHGPSTKHLDGEGLPIVNKSGALCAICHAKLTTRPADFPQVEVEKHAGQAECITCHNPHDPLEGLPPKLPHSMEGRENCQSCHNPQEPLLKIPPQVPHSLEGRSDCVSCHDIKESTQTTIPKVPHSLEGRDNCLVCHNTSAIKPFPEDHVWRTTETCLTCHQTE